eukprot:gene7063-14368_t
MDFILEIQRSISFSLSCKIPPSVGILTGFVFGFLTNPVLFIRKIVFNLPFLAPIASSSHQNDTSICKFNSITVNGAFHSVLIRGINRNAPVILFVHGGPGLSDIPINHIYSKSLEKDFVVVHYDQRGAGKSGFVNYKISPKESFLKTLTIDQHLSDLLAISEWLHNHHDLAVSEQGLYLVGGSWGTVLAIMAAHKRSDLYKKVLLRGAVINGPVSERLSTQFIRNRILSLGLHLFPRNILETVDQMEAPYDEDVEKLLRQRALLTAVGGQDYKTLQLNTPMPMWRLQHDVALAFVRSPEFTISEALSVKPNVTHSLRHIFPYVERLDILNLISELDIPIAIAHGRHDNCTAHSLVEPFLVKLKAPYKAVAWFEKSGHSPQREEPEAFVSVLKEFFLGLKNEGPYPLT